MKCFNYLAAVKKIAVVSMSVLIAAGTFSVLVPTTDVRAEGLKIADVFEDVNLQVCIKEQSDKNNDGYLSQEDINTTWKIDIEGKDVSSLSGLEIFTELVSLNCRHTKITEIDTSLYPKLEFLDCSGNDLKTLSVMKLTELTYLRCNDNEFETLNLSQNKKMEKLVCTGGKLKNINLGKSTSFKEIDISNNAIEDLDLEKLVNLERINASKNKISFLDTSYNSKLIQLYVSNNNLIGLDTSSNTKLRYLACNDNDIAKLDLRSNADLWSLECNNCKLTTLDVSQNSNIYEIQCNDNQMQELKLGSLSKLGILHCNNNKLTSLDLTGITEINTLKCAGNMLTSLDVSNQADLQTLDCDFNKNLSKLDVTHNAKLFVLSCEDCSLSEINVGNCPKLNSLTVQENSIQKLDISNNPELVLLYCNDNALTELDISKNTKLQNLYCYNNNIKSINIIGIPKLLEAFGAYSKNEEGHIYYYQIDPEESNYEWYRFKCDKDVEIISNTAPAKPSNPSGSSEPSGTTVVSSSGTFEDFVERLYVVALGRVSEEEGKAHWCKVVGNGSYSGADCARFFLTSPEFNGRNLNNEEYLKVLYKTFFDRDAANDPDGFNFWLGKIDEWGRGRVLEGFIDSTEWCNICASYGVKSGAMTAKATKASANATAFATRLYTECLGREPEEGGLNFWSLSLTNQERTGTQAAKEFFYSEEFISKGLSDDDYVTRLYKTFMGREPEADGKAHWLNQLNSGAMNRDRVFDFFSTCEEFTGICNQYAISR